MPFLEAIRLALAAILGHKLRSFLTLLGVIFGVATVIVVVSLVEGFNHYVDEKIADIGTNAFAVRKFSIDDFSSVAALNAARRRNKDIRLEDAEALRARGDAIAEVGAKTEVLGEIKYASTTLSRVRISATTANIADIERIDAGTGRYFNKGEDDTRRIVLVALVTFATAAQQSSIERDPRYPAHWWTPIDDPKKPAWEILPQEAKPGEVILSKRHELGLLSNFAPTPFVFHGERYAGLEGFWQAMLYPESPKDPRAKFPGLQWKYTRAQVAQMTAFEAKRAGDLAEENMRRMKIGWVSFAGERFAYRPKQAGRHYRLIVSATRAKVQQNPEVKKVLLATGDLILRPDHHQEPNAPAAWRYFNILMNIRKELQRTGR